MKQRRTNDVRALGRELALGVLCHLESYPPSERLDAVSLAWEHPPRGDEEGEDAFAVLASDPKVRDFAKPLVARVVDRWADIDAEVSATSRRWRLERMDRVDRNVLRLAASEFMDAPDVPRSVIISEAVRLAARYGSEKSVSFVNGLVESLGERLRPNKSHG